jgi:hypothetical protein
VSSPFSVVAGGSTRCSVTFWGFLRLAYLTALRGGCTR